MSGSPALRLIVAMEAALADGRYDEAAGARDEYVRLLAQAAAAAGSGAANGPATTTTFGLNPRHAWRCSWKALLVWPCGRCSVHDDVSTRPVSSKQAPDGRHAWRAQPRALYLWHCPIGNPKPCQHCPVSAKVPLLGPLLVGAFPPRGWPALVALAFGLGLFSVWEWLQDFVGHFVWERMCGVAPALCTSGAPGLCGRLRLEH
eukprot:229603-Chlamydomonas_euryale.AAC.1